MSFGIGPQSSALAASDDQLGTWTAGLANVLFDAGSHKFQYGQLLTWQASFAGTSDRPRVDPGAFQPLINPFPITRSTSCQSESPARIAFSIRMKIGYGALS